MVDAQGWVTGPAFDCYGARIHIRATSASALEGIEARLPVPRCETTASADRRYSIVSVGDRFELLRGDRRIFSSRSLRRVHRRLASDLHTAVSRSARGKLFVHAGTVGWRDQAIVIPGRTRAGKSSLVAALVEAGADYYSDEFAVIDRRGRVHPYPKPISLRRAKGAWPRERRASDFGGRNGTRPLPLRFVVVTKYASGAAWDPEPITMADGMMQLFANTVLARVRPRFALSVLANASEGSHAVRSDRPEAGEVAPRILGLVDEILDG